MKDKPRCSFCGKPPGRISKLVLARKGVSAASARDECLDVCGQILLQARKESAADPSKSHDKAGAQTLEQNRLSCSFCGTSQEQADWLIRSSRDLPTTYIGGQCVASGATASEGGDKVSFASWIARRMGRQETTIYDIK